ncbi:hypothetical protein GTA08_BOTSDO05546 [Botryosphaeria dothidea]|uniref:Uncharacterized protein n=1 Tax=Botryosphaeria dothidea TaxID=55169 RepID=A0A8H4ISP0_9PEZI|nr:hypothetical protein GTA08_BOTSDO05546 [Botryosphaeria dothidea]
MRWAGKLADPWLDWRFAPGVLQREPHTRRASEALILLLLCCSAPSLSPAQPSQQPLHVPPRSCFRPQSYLPITIFIAAAVNHDNPTIDASAPTTCRSSSALALAARTRPLRYAT